MYLRLEVKKNILTVVIEIHECDFVGGYFMNQWEIYNKAGFVLGGWSLGSLGLHYSNFHLVVSLLCLFKIDIHIRLMTSPIQRRFFSVPEVDFSVKFAIRCSNATWNTGDCNEDIIRKWWQVSTLK